MVWFVILAVITAGLALGLPPDPHTLHQLHVSNVGYRVAILVVLVPYGIIWYTAFYAFAKLQEYARVIKGSEDGIAFRRIMFGMGILAFSLVVPTLISLILGNIAIHHPGFKPSSVIIGNYLSLMPLVAFIVMSRGTHMLTRFSEGRPGLLGVYLFELLFIVLSVFFAYLVNHFNVHHANIYYLNKALLLSTFVVPYLFGWFAALLSAFEFWLYAKHTKGLLYKQSLRFLAYGITVVISGSIAIQFVDNTFIAAKVSQSLSSLLIFEYFLLAIIAVGLILMAMGTNKLKKIEEV